MLEESAFEQITMADLGHRLGLTKGTLYLYYESKEELFLVALDDLMASWVAELATWLEALRRPARARQVAAVIGRSLQARPRMVQLLPLMEQLIARVGGIRDSAEMEDRFRKHLESAAGALERAFPRVATGWGFRFVNCLRALVAGVFPPGRRHHGSRHLAIASSPIDEEFLLAVEALLEGMHKGARRRRAKRLAV